MSTRSAPSSGSSFQSKFVMLSCNAFLTSTGIRMSEQLGLAVPLLPGTFMGGGKVDEGIRADIILCSVQISRRIGDADGSSTAGAKEANVTMEVLQEDGGVAATDCGSSAKLFDGFNCSHRVSQTSSGRLTASATKNSIPTTGMPHSPALSTVTPFE